MPTWMWVDANYRTVMLLQLWPKLRCWTLKLSHR